MDIQVFLKKYLISDRGCWIWLGYKDKNGYGVYSTMVMGKQMKLKAHRVSYEHHRGAIPKGLFINHTCDVPGCINPDHLYAGTAQDNAIDCISRKRNKPPKGETHPNAKLTVQIVKDMRAAYANGLSMYRVARLFDITQKHCAKVLRRKSWKHVTD